MQKIPLANLDLDLYQTKLENGLEIYVVPNLNVNNIYVTFSTKYGSIHNSFVPIGEKKIVTVPNGIAHFLEHKVFEQKDGVDPFTFYSERGADANANTSNLKTTYLFSGSSFLEENLNYLLDYVQSPYFTDENVEKEKGIIEQEIMMFQDDPFSRLYERSLFNAMVNNPVRIPIAGTVKSIKEITKEDLYKCYNTFYHPSNMFVVITGNVDPIEIHKIIDNNQKKKDYKFQSELKTKIDIEPDRVYKSEDVISMNITIPKVSLNYKFNISKIKNISKRDVVNYICIFLDVKLGMTSTFNEKLKALNIVTDGLDLTYVETDDHLLFMLIADTKEPEKLMDYIKEELDDLTIEEAEFNRKKKMLLSSHLFMSDNIYQINSKIMNNIIKEGKVLANSYNEISGYNVDQLNYIMENLSFNNSNYVIINPKKN